MAQANELLALLKARQGMPNLQGSPWGRPNTMANAMDVTNFTNPGPSLSPAKERVLVQKLASQKNFMRTAAGNRTYGQGKTSPTQGMRLDPAAYIKRTANNKAKNRQQLLADRLRAMGF